jgi:hypothetical protein
MRTTKELLEIMLKNMSMFKNGLCGLVWALYRENIISAHEYYTLKDVISKGRPKRTFDDEWYWKPGNKKPRVNWINKQIEIQKKNILL